MPTPSPHTWFRPRIIALLAEAEAAGIARDISMAVITDLVNGPLAAAVPVETEDNPNRDIGEPDSAANQGTGAHPTLPTEPVGAETIQQPLGVPGRRW